MNQYRVLIDCSDKKGLVAGIAQLFYAREFNILSNNEFVDRENGRFFMRSVIEGDANYEQLHEAIGALLPHDANLKIISPTKKRVIVMATKESHALGDLLIRYEAGELDAEIVAVISNYPNLERLVKRFDIPFHTISHEGISREAHETQIIEQISCYNSLDYILLAKYMRILTPWFVEHFSNKVINIHHSFLPAFIGANPYKQAYERGVKIIGATAHFVNNNLDEGPIIAQDVINVSHSYDWKQMQRAGRDMEKLVFSRAVKLALEDRIFIHGNKTVIF